MNLQAVKDIHIEEKKAFSPEQLAALQVRILKMTGCEEKAKRDLERLYLYGIYNPISLVFLKMKDEHGWPRFAPYHLDRSTSWFEVEFDSASGHIPETFTGYSAKCFWSLSSESSGYRGQSYSSEHWFAPIRYNRPCHYYEDAFQKLFDVAREEAEKCVAGQRAKIERERRGLRRFRRRPEINYSVSCKISQKFQGCIPESVHDNIEKARPHFNNNIFLIAEAGPWAVEIRGRSWQVNPPTLRDRWDNLVDRVVDPLVIGWHDKFNQAFLIDSFDLTSVEDMVRREFSEGKIE
jgi:hypothetical protein